LQEEFDIPAVEMHLLKHIPTGSGLGGGSSDAAQMLLMLNDLFKLNISTAALKMLAAKLGSDCPFFIKNKPVFASGRGEVFEEIDLDLSEYEIKVVKSDIHISTPEAYGLVKPLEDRPSLREVIKKPIVEWKDYLINDFEEPIFNKYPEIRAVKETMYQNGAVYSSMSGSGSAVYGIFALET
ncbi:MAG: 4-(cytidine 5'-diphospho)-2-C-methyl-D-erythritol kinase, partial [Bacteroidales bacterium]|nr:4-(cytidine 5'-diphospho)-2-C-methyl-D-erythritol kinase [Bacteroidales bacterium]